MGIRDEQREKRRQEILAASLDLFIRKGYAATKISDIAEDVGMSIGLLFHYFESKEKLFEELIALGISGPMRMMASPAAEPLQFFEETAKEIFHYLRTQPFVAKMFVLMGQVFHSEAVPPKVKEQLRDFDIYAPTIKLMKQGQANGTIREGNPYALALAYWCAIHGIAVEMALQPNAPCPESGWIVDMIRRKEK